MRTTYADIVNSEDDGGWYAELFHMDADTGHTKDGRASDVFGTKYEAENWARKHGARELMYP